MKRIVGREEKIENLLMELSKNHSRRRKNLIRRTLANMGSSQRIIQN